MYSVIMNGYVEKIMPEYIDGGLTWLMIVENMFLVNALAEVAKQLGLGRRLKGIFCRIRMIIFCALLIQIVRQKSGKDIDSNRVYFGTIHSFISMSFFSHESILNLYWEEYENQIAERIENASQNL